MQERGGGLSIGANLTGSGTQNTGRPFLLEGGLDWKEMSLNPKDMEFLEGKHHHDHDHDEHDHDHHEHDHEHDETITSVGLRLPGNLNEKKLNDWVRELLMT